MLKHSEDWTLDELHCVGVSSCQTHPWICHWGAAERSNHQGASGAAQSADGLPPPDPLVCVRACGVCACVFASKIHIICKWSLNCVAGCRCSRWQWLHGSVEDTVDAFERALASSMQLEELHKLWMEWVSPAGASSAVFLSPPFLCCHRFSCQSPHQVFFYTEFLFTFRVSHVPIVCITWRTWGQRISLYTL